MYSRSVLIILASTRFWPFCVPFRWATLTQQSVSQEQFAEMFRPCDVEIKYKKTFKSYSKHTNLDHKGNLQSNVYRGVVSVVSIVSSARTSPDDEVTKRDMVKGDMAKRRALTLVLMTAAWTEGITA